MAVSELSPSDHLKLGVNTACQRMLGKFGMKEKVVYSGRVTKINRRNKEQPRVVLVTDRAVYNLLPSDFSKCRRRIDFSILKSITVSTTSDEFTFHCPSEYDYRFKSTDKQGICKATQSAFLSTAGEKLPVSKVDLSSLISVTISKELSSRENRLKRYKALLKQNGDTDDASDDEEKGFYSSYQYDDTSAPPSAHGAVSPDDFKFLKVIGRGSFGKVMLVRFLRTDTVYAMKILKKKAIIARNQVEHTQAERKILQSLQHPFCMTLRFAFQTEGKLYFVLDYFRGGELFFHLKKQRKFTQRQAQFFVAQVGSALGHLHSLGVVYRDLKPENILLDTSGNVCLTDFGLSKDLGLGDGLQSYTFCGTPEYLAPEIVMNRGHNKAVDWWSLGILLYELAIGIPPFYSQNINEMYRKIQGAPLFFPSNFRLSVPFKACAAQLLERDVKKRLGSGKDDFKEIQRHPFFIDIDWAKLNAKEIDPPYKPPVKGGDADTSMFDKQFTQEVVVDSMVEKPALLAAGMDDEFGEFDDFNFAESGKETTE